MPTEREIRKLEKEQAALDREMHLLDRDPTRDRDIAIAGSWLHQQNIDASNKLLALLNQHHGTSRD
jgi:hypothetical protein